eukprot:GEMP01054511.1.p1 GENE.GEMP01054511.1~~GEMP01054511.1.p1  ORF type:complete len:169 (+),score=53.52 GEMP01054511.1:58-564(+)
MGKGGKGKGGKGKGAPRWEDDTPPDYVEVIGEVMHPAEDELVLKCTHQRIPMFNARIFLENKEQIGKLDEIFGAINSCMLSVKMSAGMKASSFKKGSKLYIDSMKTLPLERFLPENSKGKGGKGKGGKGKGKGDKGKGKGGKGKGKGKGGDKGKGKGVMKGGKKGGKW